VEDKKAKKIHNIQHHKKTRTITATTDLLPLNNTRPGLVYYTAHNLIHGRSCHHIQTILPQTKHYCTIRRARINCNLM